MESLKRFLADEAGAVTVDWVVLTSGLAVLAVIAVQPVQDGVIDMATYIRDAIMGIEIEPE